MADEHSKGLVEEQAEPGLVDSARQLLQSTGEKLIAFEESAEQSAKELADATAHFLEDSQKRAAETVSNVSSGWCQGFRVPNFTSAQSVTNIER